MSSISHYSNRKKKIFFLNLINTNQNGCDPFFLKKFCILIRFTNLELISLYLFSLALAVHHQSM